MVAFLGFIAATAVLTVISCLVSLAGIALIIYVKGYRHFLYRLTLHLALASFVRAFFIGASVIPVDVARSNSTLVELLWQSEGACAFLGGARQYTYLWCATAIFWTCLYVVKTGIRGYRQRGYEEVIDWKQNRCVLLVKRHKYEITGHLLVILLPSFVFWVPYTVDAYGLNGPWCWIHDYSADVNRIGLLLAFRILFRVVPIIGSILSTILLSYVLVKHCKIARLRGDQWQLAAVKRVVPITIHPILFALASVGSILHPIVAMDHYDAEMVFLAIFFAYDMSITLGLFLHEEIRASLIQKCAVKARSDSLKFYVSYEDSKEMN